MAELVLPSHLVKWIDEQMPELGGAGSVRWSMKPRLPFDWLPHDRSGFAAITLWSTVHIRDRGQPFDLREPDWVDLVLHELVHVEQFRRVGRVAFPARYLALTAVHGYFHHPDEVEARERAQALVAPCLRFLSQRGGG